MDKLLHLRRCAPIIVQIDHAIPRIFAAIHSRASHGMCPAVHRRWVAAEARLVRRYLPALYTMVRMGIKHERI